jgi:hypothetical protein
VCLAVAYAAATLGILLLVFIKPEARRDLPSLAQDVVYVLLVGAVLLVLAAVIYFVRAVMFGIKEVESPKKPDQSPHATASAGSPKTQAAHSRDASPDNAAVVTARHSAT